MSLAFRQKIADGSRLGKWFHDAITIDKSANEVYQHFKDPDKLKQFVGTVQAVSSGNRPNEFEWKVKVFSSSPGETWNVKVTEDQESDLIRWQAHRNQFLVHQAEVRFQEAPKNQGTEVHYQAYFRFAGGNVSHLLSRLSRKNPEKLIREDLRRLKALVETGEIPTTEGQPHGALGKEKETRDEEVVAASSRTQPA